MTTIMTDTPTPSLGRDVGRDIAEALKLSDIDNIRSITINLDAGEPATVTVVRFVPTGNTAIGIAVGEYRLVPSKPL